MAAAAVEQDEHLRVQGVGVVDRLLGRKTSKPGWTHTTRPDIMLDALAEVARLGSGSFGYVRHIVLVLFFFFVFRST